MGLIFFISIFLLPIVINKNIEDYIMKTYSFKNSGKKASDININEKIDSITLPPLGIKTPMQLSDDGQSSLFNMHYEYEDLIHDNFKNMLLTNNGERLGRYDYGASLRELTFELINSNNFESLIMNRIKTTVEKYMPYIDLDNFTSEKIDIGSESSGTRSLVKVIIRVEYNVPQIRIIKKSLELVLYVGG